MSGSKGGPPGQGAGDEATAVAFLVVLGIAVWLVWAKARHVLVFIDYGLNWLAYEGLSAAGLLDATGEAMRRYVRGAVDRSYDPYGVQWSHMVATHKDLGARSRWFVAGAIAAMAAFAAFRMKGDGFRRQYTLTGQGQQSIVRLFGARVRNPWLQVLVKLLFTIPFTGLSLVRESREWASNGVSFIHYQAAHWKVALAGAHFDPDAEDPDQAPARTPLMWMRDNGVKLTRREGLDEDAAEAAFQRQLGPAWQGIEKAPLHMQALAVLWALNLKAQSHGKAKKQRDGLRDRLNEIYTLEAERADELVRAEIAPHLADKKILAYIDGRGNKHAFLYTAMIRVYGSSGPMREWDGGTAGELATAKFRWLKRLDRTLFYCLNNVGRRAFHVEGAGAVCHFFAERVAGGPLAEAHVDEAVDGLVGYIEEQSVEDLEDFFRVDKPF